jgi:hypothetical protein
VIGAFVIVLPDRHAAGCLSQGRQGSAADVPPRATSGEKLPAEAPPHAATPSPEVTNRDSAQRGPVDAIVPVNILCHVIDKRYL